MWEKLENWGREKEKFFNFFYYFPFIAQYCVKVEALNCCWSFSVGVSERERRGLRVRKKLINIKTINNRFSFTLFGIIVSFGEDFIYFGTHHIQYCCFFNCHSLENQLCMFGINKARMKRTKSDKCVSERFIY